MERDFLQSWKFKACSVISFRLNCKKYILKDGSSFSAEPGFLWKGNESLYFSLNTLSIWSETVCEREVLCTVYFKTYIYCGWLLYRAKSWETVFQIYINLIKSTGFIFMYMLYRGIYKHKYFVHLKICHQKYCRNLNPCNCNKAKMMNIQCTNYLQMYTVYAHLRTTEQRKRQISACLVYGNTVKKGYRFYRPMQPGCHLPNSPWPGIIKRVW